MDSKGAFARLYDTQTFLNAKSPYRDKNGTYYSIHFLILPSSLRKRRYLSYPLFVINRNRHNFIVVAVNELSCRLRPTYNASNVFRIVSIHRMVTLHAVVFFLQIYSTSCAVCDHKGPTLMTYQLSQF